jgi:hypothetical protein
MASTYSDLKIELIGTGEQVGTWGATTNTNLGTAIEDAITGSADVAFSSADVTLTLTNTNGAQTARNLRLVCTGTSGGARNLILGSGCQINKLYLVQNDLADTVTVKNTTGTGVAIPAGDKKFVFNNGTNVIEAVSSTINLTTDVTGTLPIANGGTNSTATPTSGGVAYGTGSAYAITSAGTAGQALVSAGSSAPTWQNVTDANTAGAIVERDGSGNFSAGTITADLTGGASQVKVDATTSTDTTTYPLLVGAASTGNQTPFIDTGLSYNANTDALTATTFVGALSGNATTATTATSLSTAGGSAPSYSARAWIFFNGSTFTVRATANISLVTDVGTGLYDVSFTTGMSSANYAVVGTGAYTSNNIRWAGSDGPFQTSSGMRIRCEGRDGSGQDQEYTSIVVFQ